MATEKTIAPKNTNGKENPFVAKMRAKMLQEQEAYFRDGAREELNAILGAFSAPLAEGEQPRTWGDLIQALMTSDAYSFIEALPFDGRALSGRSGTATRSTPGTPKAGKGAEEPTSMELDRVRLSLPSGAPGLTIGQLAKASQVTPARVRGALAKLDVGKEGDRRSTAYFLRNS
jgi:hypothetical protein